MFSSFLILPLCFPVIELLQTMIFLDQKTEVLQLLHVYYNCLPSKMKLNILKVQCVTKYDTVTSYKCHWLWILQISIAFHKDNIFFLYICKEYLFM